MPKRSGQRAERAVTTTSDPVPAAAPFPFALGSLGAAGMAGLLAVALVERLTRRKVPGTTSGTTPARRVA